MALLALWKSSETPVPNLRQGDGCSVSEVHDAGRIPIIGKIIWVTTSARIGRCFPDLRLRKGRVPSRGSDQLG
jgi:hypothetical protein